MGCRVLQPQRRVGGRMGAGGPHPAPKVRSRPRRPETETGRSTAEEMKLGVSASGELGSGPRR